MMYLTKIKNHNKKSWLISYLEIKKISFFCIYNVFFFKNKKDCLYINDIIDIINRSYVNKDYGFDLNIIKYDYENNIRNYELSKMLTLLIKNKFIVLIKEYYNLDLCNLKISIIKRQDLLYSFFYFYDDQFSYKTLKNILLNKVIMSKQKEQIIISQLTDFFMDFDLDLSNYNYFIEEIGDNSYSISLEHNRTKKLIYVNNVILSESNKITKIGKNIGLVI